MVQCPLHLGPSRRARPDQGPFNLQQLVNVQAPVHGPCPEAPSLSSWGVAGTAELRFAPAGVAQLAEHLFCKQAVRGSTPLASSGLAGSDPVSVRVRRERARMGSLETRSSLATGCEPDERCTTPSYANVQSPSEGCPSGQREQAVNLPASAYVGSNPPPYTPQRASPNARGAVVRNVHVAGVAQLVERQPSKLNVAGSTPVSRSVVRTTWRRPLSGVNVRSASGGSPT